MAYFKGISHVGITTQDFVQSVDLYEKLGFQLINQEDNQGSKVGFLQLNDLLIELYEAPINPVNGAINHLALDTDDIQAAYDYVHQLGFEFIDDQVMHLPFWEHGISYFNFYGPNHEIIEVCQRNQK